MKNLKSAALFFKYGYKSTSEGYKKYLRKKGIKIGENTHFYSPWSINIDTQRPWMIEIGDNVHITAGVIVLQHGYDWAVLQKKYGEVTGSSGKVKIGNNVFIGTKTTILKGVTIGDNVIIGANSLVNKNLPDNGVYAGNPARFIMTLDDYYKKRKDSQLSEAVELVREYYTRYNKFPDKALLREYFWIFQERSEPLISEFDKVHELQGDKEFTVKIYNDTTPLFKSYSDFLDYCEARKE